MWDNINYRALSWTVGVHILLLLLFLLVKYAPPAVAQPITELGIEVNLGTDEDGSGDDQPMDTEAPAPEEAIAKTAHAPKAVTHEREIITSDREERVIQRSKPVINKKPIKRTEPTPIKPVATKTLTTPTHRTSTATAATNTRARYTYPGASGAGGNSASSNRAGTGEGNGTGNGDKGVPGGTPGAKNYSGTPGTGNIGINHSIADRRIVAYPDREAEFSSAGKVVLRITVNRDGKIIAKQVKSSPGSALTQIAMRKADQIRFDKSSDAPLEQFGTITFVFKTRG